MEIVGSNPIGDARKHGTVRKPAKRRSSNLRDRLWVRLPPVLLTTCVGWALASNGIVVQRLAAIAVLVIILYASIRPCFPGPNTSSGEPKETGNSQCVSKVVE